MRTSFAAMVAVVVFLTACQKEYTETPIVVHVRTVPGLKPVDYNLQTGQDLAFALRNMYHWYQGGTSFTCSESVYRGIDLKYQLLLDDLNQTPAGFTVQVDITHLGDTIHSQTHALADTTVSWWGDTQGVSSGSFRVR